MKKKVNNKIKLKKFGDGTSSLGINLDDVLPQGKSIFDQLKQINNLTNPFKDPNSQVPVQPTYPTQQNTNYQSVVGEISPVSKEVKSITTPQSLTDPLSGLVTGGAMSLLGESINNLNALNNKGQNSPYRFVTTNTNKIMAYGGNVGGGPKLPHSINEIGLTGLQKLAEVGKKSMLRRMPLVGGVYGTYADLMEGNYTDIPGDIVSMIPNPVTFIAGTADGLASDFIPGYREKRDNIVKHMMDMQRATSSPRFAYGGQVPNIPVEVEGNEVVQTPDGQVAQVSGPNHESGGVQANLPEGTQVFSKRLEKEGKNLANRKLEREAKLNKLESMLAKNPNDKSLQNTYNRMKSVLEQEEKSDLMMQEQINQVTESMQQMAYGGKVKQYRTGGVVDDEDYSNYYLSDGSYDSQTGVIKKTPFLQDYLTKPLDYDESKYSMANLNDKQIYLPSGQSLYKDKNWTQNFETSPSYVGNTQVQNPMLAEEELLDANLNNKMKSLLNPVNSNNPTSSMYTVGDQLGFMGLGMGAVTPGLMTGLNRIGDKKNINPYTNFGREALGSNAASMSQTQGYRDQNIAINNLGYQTALKQNQNSSRSVNTTRGLNIASDQVLNNANLKVNEAYAQNMQKLYGDRAQLQNARDAQVMQGEGTRDMNDRRDRDNFYTQFNQDLNTFSDRTMIAGKNMNTKLADQDFLDMLPHLNSRGIGIRKGKNGKNEIYLLSTGKTLN